MRKKTRTHFSVVAADDYYVSATCTYKGSELPFSQFSVNRSCLNKSIEFFLQVK